MLGNVLENYSYIYMLAMIFILISTILNILTSNHGIKECVAGFVISIVVLDISILYVLSRYSLHPWIVRWQFLFMIIVFVYAAFSSNPLLSMLKNKHLRIISIDIMLYAVFEQIFASGFLNLLFVLFFILMEFYVFGILKKIYEWVKTSADEFYQENDFLKNKDDRKGKKKYNSSDKSNISSHLEIFENDDSKLPSDEKNQTDNNVNISEKNDD